MLIEIKLKVTEVTGPWDFSVVEALYLVSSVL